VIDSNAPPPLLFPSAGENSDNSPRLPPGRAPLMHSVALLCRATRCVHINRVVSVFSRTMSAAPVETMAGGGADGGDAPAPIGAGFVDKKEARRKAAEEKAAAKAAKAAAAPAPAAGGKKAAGGAGAAEVEMDAAT